MSAPAGANPRGDTAGGSAQAPSAAKAAANSMRTVCASEGDWQTCSVEKRLTDAGLVPLNKGPAPTSLFSVPGTSFALGAAVLHVYLFPSATAREKAVDGIDTVAVARKGTAASWPQPATLITSNNLAAVLVSDDGRMIERIQNAITAGLPRASR